MSILGINFQFRRNSNLGCVIFRVWIVKFIGVSSLTEPKGSSFQAVRASTQVSLSARSLCERLTVCSLGF